MKIVHQVSLKLETMFVEQLLASRAVHIDMLPAAQMLLVQICTKVQHVQLWCKFMLPKHG